MGSSNERKESMAEYTKAQQQFLPVPEDLYEDRIPFLLRAENVSRYEDNGCVYMLDRRCYPHERRFEKCESYEDVARAIEKMVTQSGGPAFAVACGMTQAARTAKMLPKLQAEAELEKARQRLASTRPTNNNVRYITTEFMRYALDALEYGIDPELLLIEKTAELYRRNHTSNYFIGNFAASLVEDGQGILTYCFAEANIVYTYLALEKQGKTNVKAYCCETRPYLQGARLTSDCISEIGFDTTLITDGMPGFLMSRGMVDIFFSGTDRITEKGDVINKVGTFPTAVMAKYHGLPYYAFGLGADPGTKSIEDVEIELRDGDEVLHCLGNRTATRNDNLKGFYPAFDCTPAEFVTGIITDKGIYAPENLYQYERDTLAF